MITKTLIPTTAIATETVTGDTVPVHMPKSNRGILQVTLTSGNSNISTVAVVLYGRLSADMDWVPVDSASISFTASGTDAKEDIQLFPEMRAIAVCQKQSTDSFNYTVELGC